MYSKTGDARFIAHLDLMRFWQRALRRAGVEVMFSEGFNPHARIAFGPPLPVGVESIGEYVDIEVLPVIGRADKIVAAEAVTRLGLEFPPELAPGDWALLSLGTASVNKAAVLATYDVFLQTGGEVVVWQKGVTDFLAQSSILVEKTVAPTKRRGKEFVTRDIRPLLRDLRVEDAGEGGILLRLEIGSNSGGSIKAVEVTQALCDFMGVPCDREELRIVRTGLFDLVGEEKVSLLPEEKGGKRG
jgi:radical SAM-linked protein